MSGSGKAPRLLKLAGFLVAASASCVSPGVAAQQTQAQPAAATPANINITPRRAVFDASKRTEVVYVFNQGTAPATVDISLVDNVMLPSGEITPLGESARKGPDAQAAAKRLRSARDLLLATPSRLILEPGKGKTIRIRASLPDGADESGEYRTHLTVSTVPSRDAGLTAEEAASPLKNELVFRVQSVFGVSIPLIIRSGAPVAAAEIGQIALEHGDAAALDGPTIDRVPLLTFALARSGVNSVYGNLEARVDGQKGSEVLGFIRGIAVYPELDSRRVVMQLSREPRPGEVITVTFLSDDPQLRSVMASERFTVR